ncbi:hypothetical protein Dimus_033930 [Dionaea muscipula]
MASSAKQNIETCKSKVEAKAAEKVVVAGTAEEKVIAVEMEKIKEAEVMAQLHAARAMQAVEKLEAKRSPNYSQQYYYCHGNGTLDGGSCCHPPPKVAALARHLQHCKEDPAVRGAQLNLQPIGSIDPLKGIVVPLFPNN